MGDLLQDARTWLHDMQRTHASQAVTWSRTTLVDDEPVTVEVELAASLGRTQFEQADEQGFVTQWESQDFIVDAADLGALDPPARGDRVALGDLEYEVLSPPGAPCFRYVDASHARVRVHAKAVGPEPEVP